VCDSTVDMRGELADPTDEWMQEVFEVMDSILGDRPEPKAAVNFMETSGLAPIYGGVPAVIMGPGEAAMTHQTNEYVYVNRIGRAVQAYSKIAHGWNAG